MEELRKYARPSTTRSRIVLEVASELAGSTDVRFEQAKVSLRKQGGPGWGYCFFGSDAPSVIPEVASGAVDVGIINPAAPLTLAYRGSPPFKEPHPFRVITVIPSFDQLAFAVHERTGLNSLTELRERRYPLRVSLRGQQDHSLQLMVKLVLEEFEITLDDITAWGGTVRYDPGLPDSDTRLGAVERGEADAIFDEAVGVWANWGLDIGMRVLPLEEPRLQHLEQLGLRRSPMRKSDYPKLLADVDAIDFSGWPVFTRADVPDDLITDFCTALEARKDRIPWQGHGPLPLDQGCRDTPDTPMDVPLHPAAERFWRERGYL